MAYIEITLNDVLESRGISKNKVCQHCNLQRTQFNNYCNNKISRVDLTILAKLCEYLECDVNDILMYRE